MDDVSSSHKRILFGLLYRPPRSDSAYLSSIENFIGLAIDTGIKDIVIIGDFNLYTARPDTVRKVDSIYTLFNLHQLTEEPGHFNDQSSSIIDLFFVSNIGQCGFKRSR